MTREEYNQNYWMFYLQLEKDFYKTLNFVEFCEDNFGTYSKEYTKQIVSIGSEVDIIFKELCKVINPSAKRKCITDYANILCGWSDLTSANVQFKFTKEFYTPFAGWTPDTKPDWWEIYNSVKHYRTEEDNYKKGNLKNTFNILMALYILNRYLCREISSTAILQEPEIKSSLFDMKGWNIYIPEGNGWIRVLDVTTHSMDFKCENEN